MMVKVDATMYLKVPDPKNIHTKYEQCINKKKLQDLAHDVACVTTTGMIF